MACLVLPMNEAVRRYPENAINNFDN